MIEPQDFWSLGDDEEALSAADHATEAYIPPFVPDWSSEEIRNERAEEFE